MVKNDRIYQFTFYKLRLVLFINIPLRTLPMYETHTIFLVKVDLMISMVNLGKMVMFVIEKVQFDWNTT